MKCISACVAVTLASAAPLHADQSREAMEAFLSDSIANWANDAVLVGAIQAQNVKTAEYDQAKIDEMDQLWRGFFGMDDAEIIANVIANPAADFLRQQVSQSDGAITEAFIMDARGLNVAASTPTSDYWQGDEAKFTQTYLMGQNAKHIGEVELDASTKAVQGQVSMTIVDQTTGEAIGALTVGLNIAALD